MLSYFYRLNSRQQVSVVILTIGLFVGLVFVSVWQPLNATLLDKRREHILAQETLASVSILASQILVLQESAEESGEVQNLTTLVNTSLQTRQLDFTRLQQMSETQLQIRLDDVDFGNVLAWIYDLETTPGLITSEISMRPSTQPGRINITVGLSRLD